MPSKSYELRLPEKRATSVVFASPHSGRDYRRDFLRGSILDARLIRTSEDAFVDMLLNDVPEFGAPLLLANAPRAYLDLNRAAEELDPALIEGIAKGAHNPRVAAGLGVVPRVVAGGRAIYRGKLSLAEANRRIEEIWVPYHAALQNLLNQSCTAFGEAILIDFHSMPHDAIASVTQPGFPRAEVILGDRFGASASSDVVDRVEAAFANAGLRVARNSPFAGAYVTQHYGRPSRHQHVIQVEIDRALYMNEQHIRPNGNFEGFRKRLNTILSEIIAIGQNQIPLAAE